MPPPDICASITSAGDLGLAQSVRDKVSLYEVRIDLIGNDWPRVAAGLSRPWIACNRLASQGGAYGGNEYARLDVLRRAVEAGAAMVDIEMCAPDVQSFIGELKGRVRLIVSHHDFERTEDDARLVDIAHRQKDLGADICKVVTCARCAEDCATVLRLVKRFRSEGVICFAMGHLGMLSRVLAPLAGAPFTYASLTRGHEAAPGQLSVDALRDIYDVIGAT